MSRSDSVEKKKIDLPALNHHMLPIIKLQSDPNQMPAHQTSGYHATIHASGFGHGNRSAHVECALVIAVSSDDGTMA